MNKARPVALALLTICISFACLSTVPAQEKDWRPVSQEELTSSTPVVEPDADAEALFWEVRIDDSDSSDFSMTTYVRVKIFTERGREKFSKFDIPYMDRIKIKDLAARVIRSDGSIVEIRKEDVFDREIIRASGIKIKARSFAVPNIQPGVIVEYRYRQKFSDTTAAGVRLEFQQDVPVRNLVYYYKPYRGGEPTYQTFNMDAVQFSKADKGFYVASLKNVPAFREERYMPPEDTVRPWVRLGSGISFWGDNVKVKLAKWVKEGASGDVKKMAAQLTSGVATDQEKIAILYRFCQEQIRNLEYDPKATDEERSNVYRKISSVEDVLKGKQGSFGWINMLFASMAASVGLDAHIAYIGDRSEVVVEPQKRNDSFMSPRAVAIRNGKAWDFYSPGVRFLPLGQLYWTQENSWALVISEKEFEWARTPYTDHKTTLTRRTGKFKLLDDGTLVGDVQVEMTGQVALSYRLRNYDETADKLASMLATDVKRNISAAELEAGTVENVFDVSKPLVMRYKVKIPAYAARTGKRLFFQPNFFEFGEQPVFSSESRKYDIFFRYPWSEQDEITIEWPEGFAPDAVEPPADINETNGLGYDHFKTSFDKNSRTLTYKRDFVFGTSGQLSFKRSNYDQVKKLFDSFTKADSHTMTLKQP